MKKTGLLFCMVILLFLFSQSLAEQAIAEDAALEAMLAAHPQALVTAQDQWGDTAAAVLSHDGRNILCVAEKQNSAWIVTIDNPTALRQGEQIPTILLDTDITLFWSYHDDDRLCEFGAIKENGLWGNVTHRFVDSIMHGEYDEHLISLMDVNGKKVLLKTNRHEDENENLLYAWADMPIPADWLAAYADLAHFDLERFPEYYESTHDWTNEYVRRGAAEQLLPSYAYHGGTLRDDSLEFLMEKPDGAWVFVGVTWNEWDGWSMTESTPLPPGTTYGYQNYESSLCLPGGQLVDIGRFADDTWGARMVYAIENGQVLYALGQNWIEDRDGKPVYGTHPWSDITTLDWTALPLRLQDALQGVDASRWAVVNNPDPEDRLHLRASPSREAASLGKYYNNTPVHVLDEKGDWLHVSVFGIEGYMLRQYVATGEAMNNVETAGLQLDFVDTPIELYQNTKSEQPFYILSPRNNAEKVRILGIVNDAWYHVWFVDTGRSGYVRQTDMWPGNG